MFELAHRFRLPMILFGEGGGGRPGEDNIGPRVAIDTHTFTTYSQLSALVPLIAVVNGRTFAGNTVLVACRDVIIATEGGIAGERAAVNDGNQRHQRTELRIGG